MEPVDVGILSLLPPIIAISLALVTKEVISSLMLGILSGGLIYAAASGGGLVAMSSAAFEIMSKTVGTPDKFNIILFLALLGALVCVVNKAGGSQAYGQWATRKITSRRAAELATSILGILIFIDDYFNCLTVGTVMKPVTDKYRISRAKLAYIIDTTAAPVCIIAPISSWAAAVGSTLYETGAFPNEMSAFFATIPYNMYAILSILMVTVLSLTDLEFGPMAKVEYLAETKGELGAIDQKAAQQQQPVTAKGTVYDLLIPIAGLFLRHGKGKFRYLISGAGMVLGMLVVYLLGTVWYMVLTQCTASYAIATCVAPFALLDLGKLVVALIVGNLIRDRLIRARLIGS